MQQSSGERWGREGFTFWLKLTSARKGKAKVWRWSSGILGNCRQTVISGYRVNLCVSVCTKACVMGYVPPCRVSPPAFFLYFRSPSSPWMVFLMRSRRVVCHWSRREMESNSLTWRRVGGEETRTSAFFFFLYIIYIHIYIPVYVRIILTCQRHCAIWQKYSFFKKKTYKLCK